MERLSRRSLLRESMLLAGSLAASSPLMGEQAEAVQARKLKIVVAGAHPDDPESGCGGTIARLTGLGHEVVILYLTRGEAGIKGKSAKEAAEIRTSEALNACAILKVRAVFANQIDGDTVVSPAHYDRVLQILEAEQPAILFTQWPIDSHRDHRATSLLVYDSWLSTGRKADLYYYEVESGLQTQCFHPTDYVDISSTEKRKRDACFAHASQRPGEDFYPLHMEMHRFRGMEYGCRYAEAFVRHGQNPEPRFLRNA